MSFLYHFRVLELGDRSVRVRVWVTNPDVLAWGAKAVPKNTRNILNTQHFAMILLREQCTEQDSWTIACAKAVEKSRERRQKAIAAGKTVQSGEDDELVASSFFSSTGLSEIASLKVETITNFPAPKAAWDPKTPAAKVQYESYWAAWRAWDGTSDPPENLARFDLAVELKTASSMPTGWPSGIKGTTAYARS